MSDVQAPPARAVRALPAPGSVRRLGKGVPGTVKPYRGTDGPALAAVSSCRSTGACRGRSSGGDGHAADDRQGLDAAAARARASPGSRRSADRISRRADDAAAAALGEIERKVSGLGAKVAAERAERGWSLAQLAQRAGMSPAAVHKIEKSGMTPTIASLMKIAAALGRSVSFFVEEPAHARRQRRPPRRAGEGLHVQAGPGAAQPVRPLRAVPDRRRRRRGRAVRRQRAGADEPSGRGAGDRPRGRDGVHRRRREYEVGAGDSIHFRTLLRALVAQPGGRAGARDLARRALLSDNRERMTCSMRCWKAWPTPSTWSARAARCASSTPAGVAVLGYDSRRGADRPRQPLDDPPLAPRRHAVPAPRSARCCGRARRAADPRRAGLVRPPRRVDGAGRLRRRAVRDRGGQRRGRRLPRHHRAAGVRGGARPRRRRAGARGGDRRLARADRRRRGRGAPADRARPARRRAAAARAARCCGSRRRAAQRRRGRSTPRPRRRAARFATCASSPPASIPRCSPTTGSPPRSRT